MAAWLRQKDLGAEDALAGHALNGECDRGEV
jgi:hypothetical protein